MRRNPRIVPTVQELFGRPPESIPAPTQSILRTRNGQISCSGSLLRGVPLGAGLLDCRAGGEFGAHGSLS